jgi:hypothetical protein
MLQVILPTWSAILAFVAAWRWYQASTIPAPDFNVVTSYSVETLRPITQWAAESARLNKAAAWWSAAAAVVGGLSALLPLLHAR